MIPRPNGTVTFLFTDIEGSTQIALEQQDTWETLRSRHHEILRGAIELQHGFVFQIVGDAFCAAFQTAHEALSVAARIQIDLQNEDWGNTAIKVRMGIHTGTVEYQPSGEYRGYLTLSRVQRIMSAAHGGQVLVSFTTQELVQDGLSEGLSLLDLGEHRLRDMVRPEHIYQLVIPNLPSQFPPLKALDAPVHNLPAQMTRFIGREKEIKETQETLGKYRLVTLTGSGGAGKTRLSLEIARQILGRFPDGVWLVELAPVSDAMLIPQTLVSVFNLREDRHRSTLEVLTDYLRTKKLLLILDNCEHLIEAAALCSETLLQSCPQLRILATSREALGINGEMAYRVPSLTTPNPDQLPTFDQLEQVDSIRLFIDRAVIAKPGFALTKENASALAQICYRLDGIPLAIELAAARIKMLAPEQIAARLDDRFRLLTGGSRTALPRQQTLRAMIDWSYSLLSDEEKTLFRRLAVFVGGWTLEAAEAVCGEERSGIDILELLPRLVDKSLVVTEESIHGIRYHRLETIRQYSREKFFETDEVESIRDKHLEFFVQFAELVDENLKGGNQMLWQALMADEQDNLRAALQWGLLRNPEHVLRIVGAANLFWTAGGYSAEGFRWTQRALEVVDKISREMKGEDSLRIRAKALCGLTRLYLSLGDNLNARRVAEESVNLYRQTQDHLGLAFALVILAYPLLFLSERTLAEAALQESYGIANEAGDVYLICRSLNMLARVITDLYHDAELSQHYIEESYRRARDAGLRSQEAQASGVLGSIAIGKNDYGSARAHYQEAVRVYEEIGARFNVILEKSNLAHLERKLGNYDTALEYYRETILAFRDIGQSGAVAHQLECFGFITLAQNDIMRAVQLFAAASALRERANTPMTPAEQSYFDEQIDVVHKHADVKEFDSAWSQGHDMSMEQAVAFALER
jgi:predicted ATPase/class 3 adenylate cyclase